MSLGSTDEEILSNVHKMKIAYNILPIGPRDMILLSFDSPHYDESNKLCYVIL